jgi:MarR-like DNA-binding transcriptional regulator SgrR of sgrS sRNA
MAHFIDGKINGGKAKLPEEFRHKPIEILISPTRVNTALRENIRKAVYAAVGIEPHFISVPLQEVGKLQLEGQFDLYAGTVGLADPDPEGVMSFYLESDTPLIYPMGNDFLKRLDLARREKDTDKKLEQMRAILKDAIDEGDVLPLFHLSTLGIGRSELDFSQVPSSDESVTLSKIRFQDDLSHKANFSTSESP